MILVKRCLWSKKTPTRLLMVRKTSLNKKKIQQKKKKEGGGKTLEEGILQILNCDPYYKRHLQEVPETEHKSSAPEIEQELKTAFELYSKGLESIPCKEVGYVLRTLGQNPTEDEVIALVCEAGCDWEGNFTCYDFLKVAVASVQKQVNRLDDVRAAL